MGFRGISRSVLFFIVPLLLFSAKLDAKHVDAGCAGMIREVVRLGGNERVEHVELINSQRAAQLARYTRGVSVQDQINAGKNFGFVAIRDEAIAGFMVLERRQTYMIIRSIAVAPEAEGMGVGRDLVEEALKSATSIPGMETMQVLLAADDEASIGFFTSVGLKQVDATSTGLLFQAVVNRPQSRIPELQLAPKPQVKKLKLMVATIPATKEFLHEIDPTLEHADDTFDDEPEVDQED